MPEWERVGPLPFEFFAHEFEFEPAFFGGGVGGAGFGEAGGGSGEGGGVAAVEGGVGEGGFELGDLGFEGGDVIGEGFVFALLFEGELLFDDDIGEFIES